MPGPYTESRDRRHVDAVKVLAIPVLLRARHMKAPESSVVIEFRLLQFADVGEPRTILAVRHYKARSAVPDSVGVVSFEASAPSRDRVARLAKASTSVRWKYMIIAFVARLW